MEVNIPSESIPPPASKNGTTTTSSRLSCKLNLFSHHPLWSSKLNVSEQLLSTRLFLILLFISFLTVILYTSLTVRTHNVTLKRFSLAEFERLKALYPLTINVPCRQVSIPHNKFLQLTTQFHQICSSQFIDSKWISSLFLLNSTSHHILDFRTFTFAQFRALALLCQTARQAVNDAHRTFMSHQLITSHAFSRTQFNQIIAARFNNFKHNVMANEKRISKVVSMAIAHNRLLSALRTNYYIQSVPGSRNYLTYNGVYKKENVPNGSICDCQLQGNQCFSQAGSFYNWTVPQLGKPPQSISSPPRFQIPGLMAGCLPLDSIRQSTLECLYNQSCVDALTLQPNLSRPKALNISLSQFPLTATIGSLFDESLFIESWFNESDFSQYFATCAPKVLSYTYKGRLRLISMLPIYIIAFSGLFIVLEIFTPILVKLWSRINSKKQANQSTTQLKQINIESIDQNTSVTTDRPQTKRTFTLFSFFDENDLEENYVGTISTVLYIVILLVGILIFVLFFSIVKYTQTHTIISPSQSEFERLKSLQLTDLVCPCSHWSTPHKNIMSMSPRYHQICSSEYLQSWWLSYFGHVEIDVESVAFISLDFRINGLSFFELIGIFCRTAEDIVENSLNIFRSTRLVTVDTLSFEQFNDQTSKRLKQFQQETIASFLNLNDLIRSSIQTNHLISGMWTNSGPRSSFDNRTSKWSLYFQPRNFFTNSCSCALSNQCTRPIGFYFQTDTVYSSPNVTVPGLVLGCYPIDSLLLSTLECFYRRKCLKRIIDLYDFDVVGLVHPLDKRIVNIQPLRKMEKSHFPPNTSMETIVSQLFVEDWISSSNFTAYYTHCAPKQCRYSEREHYSLLFILAIMLGFYGGLSAVLESILPPIVKGIRRLWIKRHRQQEENSTTVTVESNASTNQVDQPMKHRRFLPVRICLLVFGVIVLFALLYLILLHGDTKSQVIKSPTADTVDRLHSRKISTLSCPCSTATIPRSKVLSITAQYHPICSSKLVSPSYWSELFQKGDNISLILSAQYQLLASICRLTRRTVENTQNVFGARELITMEAMTRPSFDSNIDTLVSTFIDQVSADYHRTLSFIIGSFEVNQLLNIFTSNWKVDFTNEKENFVIATRPRIFSSSNCTCATTSDCIEQTNEGVISGCFPFDGFRLTKFENTSLGELHNKLFVEKWYNHSNYTAYFETCRPIECRYGQFDRKNLLFILIFAIGLYGGLTYGLHLIIGQTLHGCFRRKTKTNR